MSVSLGRVSACDVEGVGLWVWRGLTKQLLCRDEQMCDGLFDLGKLLLGLLWKSVSVGVVWLGRGVQSVHSWAHAVMTMRRTPGTSA